MIYKLQIESAERYYQTSRPLNCRKGSKNCWFSPTFQVLFDLRHSLFLENGTLDACFLLGAIVGEQPYCVLPEKKNGNQVADSHQRHRDICQAPYHIKSRNRAKEYHAAYQYPVGVQYPFLFGDEANVCLSIIIIPQNTAECEEEQCYGNKYPSGCADLIGQRLLS